MKKQLAIGLMSGVALLALAACGSNTSKSSSDKKIQLTMWQTFSDTETPVFNQIVKDYEKENPNVEIKAVRMPSGDDYNQQLVQAIGGNSAPDLARVEVTAVPKYAKLGALEKLDGYEGFSDIKKEVYPATMQSNLYNGSYYGIPLDTSTRIAIYNKSLLEKAGVKEVPKDFDTLINDTKS